FGPTTAVPNACKVGATGNTGSACNVYTFADFSRAKLQFDCSVGSPYQFTSPSRYWCPTARKTAALDDGTGTKGPPDWIGVYMSVRHQWLSKLFASTTTI